MSYVEKRNILYWPNMRREQFEKARADRPVVVVPVGSIEQHGPHCPVDVDISNAHGIVVHAAELVQDFPFIVGPEISLGFTHYNRGFPGTVTLALETFINVVCDVCRSIHGNGFERIVLVNGHGGNHHPMRSAAVKLAEEDIYVLALSHWELVRQELIEWSERDQGSIGHGGEWETSIQLYLRPELVDRSKQVAENWVPSVSPEFAHITFPERQRETPHGVMGDPTVASAEKGERYVKRAAEKLARLARAYREQEVRRYRWFEQA